MEGGARLFKIAKEGELRIEAQNDTPVYVKMTNLPGATAEIFGCELAPQRKYQVYRGRCAVFSWTGCEVERLGGRGRKEKVVSNIFFLLKVEVEGECSAYVVEDTPMLSYLNVHTTLESRRVKARAEKGYGPKVMIVGSGDVGKSTLARILLSYAARMGSVPIHVDLDVGQNAITVPGMLAACHVSKPVDVELGMTQLSPLAYFFGHTTPSANLPLYRKQVDVLAGEISKHLASKPESRASGVVLFCLVVVFWFLCVGLAHNDHPPKIVNTCGWVEKEGYELLVYCIRAFKVDVVLVIDNDRLFTDLRNRDFAAQTGIEFVKLNKSGGVLRRDADRRAKDRQLAIREYFYGARGELHPHHTVVSSSVLHMTKVGGGPQAPDTALPLGAERTVDVTLAGAQEKNTNFWSQK